MCPGCLENFTATTHMSESGCGRVKPAPWRILSAIADGSLDLALVSAPDRFPARIEMRLLSEEPMMYVCRPDHHLAQRDHVGLTELAAEDLIGFPAEFGLRRLVDDAFAEAGVAPHTPYEVSASYSIAADLVRHGLGTIFMPASEASPLSRPPCGGGAACADLDHLPRLGGACEHRTGQRQAGRTASRRLPANVIRHGGQGRFNASSPCRTVSNESPSACASDTDSSASQCS